MPSVMHPWFFPDRYMKMFSSADWQRVSYAHGGYQACKNGDAISIRRYLASQYMAVQRARFISRPLQIISSLWRSDLTDPRETAMSKYIYTSDFLLNFACKMGHEEAVAEIVRPRKDIVLDISDAARLAVAEGHTRCLERLLSRSASFMSGACGSLSPALVGLPGPPRSHSFLTLLLTLRSRAE